MASNTVIENFMSTKDTKCAVFFDILNLFYSYFYNSPPCPFFFFLPYFGFVICTQRVWWHPLREFTFKFNMAFSVQNGNSAAVDFDVWCIPMGPPHRYVKLIWELFGDLVRGRHSILKVGVSPSVQGRPISPDWDRRGDPTLCQPHHEQVTNSRGTVPVAPQQCHLSREKTAETETNKSQESKEPVVATEHTTQISLQDRLPSCKKYR